MQMQVAQSGQNQAVSKIVRRKSGESRRKLVKHPDDPTVLHDKAVPRKDLNFIR